MTTTHHQHLSNQSQPHAPLGLTSSKQGLASSPTLAINEAVAARKAAGQSIIHLGFGEASFPLHPLLDEAFKRAARQTSYAPVLGLSPLRRAIADYLRRTRGLDISPEFVAVAPGSKPLLYALLQVLEGDVLLPSPSWVSYAPQARLANRRVYIVEADPRDHHRLTRAALAETLARARREGGDPRILVINTPSNPTGGMWAREDSEAVAAWAREEGITLISDEIYAELAHGWREHYSPARFYPEGCIVTGGLSKAFSAGGWRLGYAAIPGGEAGRRLVSSLGALASEIWSSASTPVMEAAITAYSPNNELAAYVRASALLHGHATSRLHETLVSLGALCPRPAGAFYLYPDFAPWRSALHQRGITTVDQLARHLIDAWGIAALPATAFGEQPDALRLRLATSMLFLSESPQSRGEQDETLWSMLSQAAAWTDGSNGELELPMLEKARTRFAEFVESLNNGRSYP